METNQAFRSFLFALWGIFLCFVGLNPLGMFLFLWVLVIPAWVMGCMGLYHGVRSLRGREPGKRLATAGVAMSVVVLLVPFYPFVVPLYPGITKGQTASLLADCTCEQPGAVWKAGLHGDAVLAPLRAATDGLEINCPDAAGNVLKVLSANRSSSSRAVLVELARRDNSYQHMIGTAGLVAHGLYPLRTGEGAYLIQTVEAYDPEKNYDSWQVRQALRTLGDIGDGEAVPAVLSVFSRPGAYHTILGEACGALTKIGDRQAIPALRTYLKGPREDAVAAVFRCLVSLGDSAAVPLGIGRVGHARPDRSDKDIVEQLEVVTGKRFGYHGAAWEAWWASVEGAWRIPERFVAAGKAAKQ